MAPISRLPAELLEEIYHYLDSIDDVHHFARTCKSTYDVIRHLTAYTRIMRSVIGKSLQHRFDIPLSRILGLHCHIVQHFKNGNVRIPATQPQDGFVFHPFEAELVSAVTGNCPFGPCTICLPDTRIHEILARYQGIRILEDEWLARQLTDSELLSADFDTDESRFRNKYNMMLEREEQFRDGGLPARSSSSSESYTSFNTDQRNRLYAAVTSIWLLNEIRWVLTHFQYPAPSFILQIRLLDACKQWIQEQTVVPLLDDLDRHAVFRFLYHHLLPTHGHFLADRCSSKLPLSFPSYLELSKPVHTRFLQLFLIAGQTYLQPPDIIDLVIRSRVCRKRPYPELPIPPSTEHHQRPSPTLSFPPSPPPTASPAIRIMHTTRLLQEAIFQLNMIAHATINQNEVRPQRHWVVQPDATSLFKLVDDSAAFLEAKALSASLGGIGRLQEVKETWQKQWGETWWKVWWWANSEEKARAKMQRWKVDTSSCE